MTTRLVSLTMAAALLLYPLSLLAQGISASFSSTPLATAIKSVCDKSGYHASFNGDEMGKYTVTCSLSESSIEEAMAKVLEGKPYTYRVDGKQVIISKKAPQTQAQQKNQGQVVKGTVVDEKGETLPGANVILKGGSYQGTSTDTNGNFSLGLGKNHDYVLIITYIGYQEKQVSVKSSSKDVVDLKRIRLVPDDNSLNDVVVNGIFTRSAESFTGSTQIFKSEELRSVGNLNVLQSLKNLDPSFEMVENIANGSNPNATPTFQMRGQSGFPDLKGEYQSDPNTPLFIVDGFESTLTKVIDMDMNRVASVTLLKDASAKAIYGSKAANGVVVIETKKPEAGRLHVTYTGSVNIETPDFSSYDLTNAAEKLQVEYNAGLYDYLGYNGVYYWHNPSQQYRYTQEYNRLLQEVSRGVDTDWLAQPIRTGAGQKHVLHVDGGDASFRYGADFQYNNVAGVMKGSDRNTISGAVTLSYRYKNLMFRDNLEVVANAAYNSPYGTFDQYARMNPYLRIYDDNGDVLKTLDGRLTTVANPIYNSTINTKDVSKYTQITNNFYAEWQVYSDLRLTGRIGMTKTDNRSEIFHPASHTDFFTYTTEELINRRGTYRYTDGDRFYLSTDINANWSKQIDKHMFFLNAGWNLTMDESHSMSMMAEGFPNDQLDDIVFARQYEKDGAPSGYQATTHDVGVLGAFNYSYDNRYLLDLSMRYSGSSQFGKDNRWGAFWSGGLGWNIHHEKFMKNVGWIDQLKIRGSIGYTGSQNFNSYQAQSTYSYFTNSTYLGNVGAYLLGLANSSLKWQRKKDLNVGLDFQAFRRRLGIRLDYYIGTTDNLLTDVTVPSSTGFSSYKENLGKVENKGFEFKVNYRVWEDRANGGYLNLYVNGINNTNTIKEISNSLQQFNDAQTSTVSTKPITRFYEGCSMSAIWAVPSLGIDPASGKEVFVKKNGDLTYTWDSDDLQVCGDTEPKFFGSVGLNSSWKGFSLNIAMSYRLGGQYYNQTLVDKVENANLLYNVDRRIFTDRWVNVGDVSRFKDIKDTSVTRSTSRFVEDENTWTLSSINFSYDFDRFAFVKNLGFNRLRLSFDMNDVARISTVKQERGTSYPFARTFSFSLQAMF